jgi:putative ABC transport system substrate-binding protein
VGLVYGGTTSDGESLVAALRAGLQELGYREGDNITLDTRYADYSPQRAAAMAAELAALKTAVIIASGAGIGPACRLAPQIPVVFLHSGDPVVAGFADSFARPGRNATGVSLLALDLIPKRIELLVQMVPGMRRLAFLASPEHPGQQYELKASREAAERFRLTVDYHEARTPAELGAALPAVAAQRPDAAMLFSDALMVGQRKELATFFSQHHIPSAAGWVGFPEVGHLLSYGPQRAAAWRRLPHFVDKILRGTAPGELPVELPTVIEMAVNRRTAGAMKLALPATIITRADKVFD